MRQLIPKLSLGLHHTRGSTGEQRELERLDLQIKMRERMLDHTQFEHTLISREMISHKSACRTGCLKFRQTPQSTPNAARRAALLENIGELLLQEGLAEGAAARFEAAADAATDPVIAGRQRLRAARVLVDDDRYKAAEALFRRVSRDVPALTGEAELGRAELRLREGKVEQALGLFERAAQHTFDPDLASVARLGRTVCLERLGDLESALAELEQDDMLPEEIAEERAGQLRSRRQPR
jgi:tetratricopeptide (TPR) repeat protein